MTVVYRLQKLANKARRASSGLFRSTINLLKHGAFVGTRNEQVCSSGYAQLGVSGTYKKQSGAHQ